MEKGLQHLFVWKLSFIPDNAPAVEQTFRGFCVPHTDKQVERQIGDRPSPASTAHLPLRVLRPKTNRLSGEAQHKSTRILTFTM